MAKSILDKFILLTIDELSELGIFEKTEFKAPDGEQYVFYRFTEDYYRAVMVWLKLFQKREPLKRLGDPYHLAAAVAMGILTLVNRRITSDELQRFVEAILLYLWIIQKRSMETATPEERRLKEREDVPTVEEALNLLHEKGIVALLSPLESVGFLKMQKVNDELIDT